ncbi:MAG: cytochrome c family protein [Burkholderiales bacterium]
MLEIEMTLVGRFCLPVALAMAVACDAHAAGDANRGARIFTQCMACHSTKPREHLTGPSLANIWNHKAGSADRFMRYSDAMKQKNFLWTAETLDKWLRDPAAFVPGTSMTYPGLKDAQARLDVIAYLRAVSEGKAPQEAAGGMRRMRGERLNLRQAPAEGQVTSMAHCGDTYAIATADGKNQKIWEFNLRLKTDSSQLGPIPGRPIVIGAGMQGDRASVVFAAPTEISAFIRESCPL